jgi:cytidine deaminase
MYTEDWRILTSVAAEAHNTAAVLCHETGAICEAHKHNVAVTASVCVSRLAEDDPFMILTPCGIRQERPAFWGGDVEVAVPNPEDPTKWQTKRLRDVQPHYWYKVFVEQT